MEKEGSRIVISTFYEGQATKKIIPKLSPDKLILIIDEPKDESKKEKMNQSLSSIKDFFKGILPIETLKITSYDIPKIMSEVISKIDHESKNNNRVIIHITEGRKTTSLALLFASYMRKDKVDSSYYITEEDHQLIQLPSLSFDINETKKDILRRVHEGKDSTGALLKELEIKQSAVYQNVQELKKQGYLKQEDKLEITDLGKIMIA